MSSTDLSKLVPGFDFLQGLMKTAGGGVPSISQWIAPTLDPAEIDKRISELRTVQFWLEQNARMLAATIQALEVQRMTLATLQTMNLPMTQLRDAMKLAEPAAPAPVPPPAPAPARAAAARGRSAPDQGKAAGAAPAPAAGAGAVDPMQWWTALTRQFTELATKALDERPGERTRPASAAAGAGQEPPATSATAARGAGRKAPAKAPSRRSR